MNEEGKQEERMNLKLKIFIIVFIPTQNIVCNRDEIQFPLHIISLLLKANLRMVTFCCE